MPEPSLVAVIPAAGRATRLGELPCSKELLPVGFMPGERGARPRPVSHYLLEQFRRAGCRRLFFVLREGKWDIARYYGSGESLDMDIGYLLMREPYGPPFTVAQALPFVGSATVLLGFPDILLDPPDAFAQAVAALRTSHADVMLGSFPLEPGVACDVVEGPLDAERQWGPVQRLEPKESGTSWQSGGHGWLFAVWGERFSRYLASALEVLRARAAEQLRHAPGVLPEWPVGSVLAMALADGLRIERVHFPQGRFLDVGEPARLARAHRFPGVWDGLEAQSP